MFKDNEPHERIRAAACVISLITSVVHTSCAIFKKNEPKKIQPFHKNNRLV
jgi:hypothetical protein